MDAPPRVFTIGGAEFVTAKDGVNLIPKELEGYSMYHRILSGASAASSGVQGTMADPAVSPNAMKNALVPALSSALRSDDAIAASVEDKVAANLKAAVMVKPPTMDQIRTYTSKFVR